ncbi:hypothetical protein HDU93_003995 [Gonapodya sp. JEL0774]|nr:hypothetical protein HDU93_003995 [Gonapodya sp. JEL0774]
MLSYFVALAIFCALILLLYRSTVPSHNAHLPNLAAYQSELVHTVGSTPEDIVCNTKSTPIAITADVCPDSMLPGGGWIHAPSGTTRYYLFGPENGKKMVYVNGFSAVSGSSRDFLLRMAGAGYRVLTYDHYGRGHSSCPPGLYDLAFHLSQLRLVILELGFHTAPFTLVGISMSGAIVTAYAKMYPREVETMVLMAPSGMMRRPVLQMVLKVPLLGDIFFHLCPLLIRRMGIRAGPAPSKVIPPSRAYLGLSNDIQLRVSPGHRRAILQTCRNMSLWGMEDVYEEVGRHGRKVVLIWGTDDRVVPYSVSRKVCSLLPRANLITIEGAGHMLVWDFPEKVANSVIKALDG